jgi:hypothetical protein
MAAWRPMEKDHGDDEQQKKIGDGLWKRREVEKSKSRLSHPAWKSRKPRGIPTFHTAPAATGDSLKSNIPFSTKRGHF